MKRLLIGIFISLCIVFPAFADDYKTFESSGYSFQVPTDWDYKIGNDGRTTWYYPSYAYRHSDDAIIGLICIDRPKGYIWDGDEEVAIEQFEIGFKETCDTFDAIPAEIVLGAACEMTFTQTINGQPYVGKAFVIANEHFFTQISYLVKSGVDTEPYEADYNKIIESGNLQTAPEEDDMSDIPTYTKYSSGQYKVGTDIPAGKYVVFSTEYNGKLHGYIFETTDANSTDYVQTASFYYETIIEITEGNYLKLDSAYAIPMEENPEVDITKEGTFLVGTHIDPGEYKIEQIDDKTGGYFFLYRDFTKNNYAGSDRFEGSRYISVEDGQLLCLDNARLVLDQ